MTRYKVSDRHNRVTYKGRHYKAGENLPDDFPESLVTSHKGVFVPVPVPDAEAGNEKKHNQQKNKRK